MKILTAVLGASVIVVAGCSAPPTATSGTLRVGIVSLAQSDTLDPAAATTAGGYAIAAQLYDTLTEYGPDGKLRPRLAESVEPGKTADEWTVRLRDASWQNGDPVTAKDVVATIQRWFDQKLPPTTLVPFIDPAKIDVPDQHTLVFHLKYPTTTFSDAFTSPTAAIVPAGFDPKHPVGSGPYALDDFDPGVRVTFKADEHYWNGAPHSKALEFVSFADGSSEVNALLGKQIDVASQVDPALVSTVKADQSLQVSSFPSSGTLTWVMNVQQKPFDDPVVRQAFRLAVDRQQLIDQVYDGYATLGNDYFSPFDPLYDHDLPQRTYDPNRAKAVLQAAGYTAPVTVQLVGTDNRPTSERQNQLLIQQAAAAGFDVQFKQVDQATFYGDAYGTYPLSLSYWGFLDIFDQAAETITKDAPYNSSHWTDPQYDKLFDQAVQTIDEPARADLVHRMQKIEYDSGAYVVPVFLDSVTAHTANVEGFEAYPNTDGPNGYHFDTLTDKG